MTKRKAIEESIAHWGRMITWAKKQDKKGSSVMVVMHIEIEEDWGGDYCSLCEKYGGECTRCPLYNVGYDCEGEDSPWKKVAKSQTWGEWVENAKKMKKVLEGLL